MFSLLQAKYSKEKSNHKKFPSPRLGGWVDSDSLLSQNSLGGSYKPSSTIASLARFLSSEVICSFTFGNLLFADTGIHIFQNHLPKTIKTALWRRFFVDLVLTCTCLCLLHAICYYIDRLHCIKNQTSFKAGHFNTILDGYLFHNFCEVASCLMILVIMLFSRTPCVSAYAGRFPRRLHSLLLLPFLPLPGTVVSTISIISATDFLDCSPSRTTASIAETLRWKRRLFSSISNFFTTFRFSSLCSFAG